jgi:hypothetical protein
VLGFLLAVGFASSACNDRFQFDVPVAGAGGSAGQAGASFSGVAGSSAAGGHSDTPAGGQDGVPSAGNAGDAGSAGAAGAAPISCGGIAACPAELHCSGDLCAQCASDADCVASGLPRCDLNRHRCVPCVTTADCNLGFACDSLANRCLKECRTDGDCKDQHGCDERRLVCYECDEDYECAGSPLGSLCASDGSGCVECLKDAECPGRHCDPLVGRCVECRDGLDCPSRLCSPATFTCLPS